MSKPFKSLPDVILQNIENVNNLPTFNYFDGKEVLSLNLKQLV